jgi:D-alanine-D-alanine ligase
VEALEGVEAYMHFVPEILEKLNIPFTGGSSESLSVTTNKVFSKKMFDQFEISTPKWITSKNSDKISDLPVPCIIKPISVDASVGLDDSSIIYDFKNLSEELQQRIERYGACFIEEFIDGREFNISVIDTENGPLVLPIAEIRFENYPQDKVKIISYDAKWNDDSFEYHNTVRHFDFDKKDENLLAELKKITLQCWHKFELKGYARVDYRVDKQNNIYVLEINVNPCISPDGGFFAACEKYGWNYTKMVEVILSTVQLDATCNLK